MDELSDPPASTARLLDLIDKAYEVAEDPSSFEALLDAATRYFFTGSEQLAGDIARSMAHDPYLKPHVARVARQLAALAREREAKAMQPAIPGYAQIVVGRGGAVLAINPAAAALTGVSLPANVARLPFDRASLRSIDEALRGLATNRDDPAARRMLNITLETSGASLVGLLARTTFGETADAALVLSISHIDWQAKLEIFCAPPFDLTRSEAEVMAGLMEGLTYDEIAERRGRLVSTVRSQAKSIMRKTGRNRVGSLIELGVSLGYLTELSDAIARPTPVAARPARPTLTLNEHHRLDLPGGRCLGYRLHGPADGRSVLFFHGLMMGPTITPNVARALDENAIRLIAPSRPHFGETSPPASGYGFNETVVADAAALVEHLGLEDIVILAHQGGVSHGFRAAARLGNRLRGMVMVGAGIPIDEARHFASMNRQTRLAAAATRHAPMLMELMVRAGIAVYRQRGLDKFLFDHFAENKSQLETLRDPDTLAVLVEGLDHMIAQGPKAFVVDGGAAMADWAEDFVRVAAPCHWIHGTEDPVLSPDDIADWIARHRNHSLDPVEGGTASLLYTHSDEVMAAAAALFG